MRNTSGYQGKNERKRKKKWTEPHTTLTRKFLEVLRCHRAKQRQRNVQKKCAARPKMFFFANFFFAVFVVVAAWLALHEFIFCFSKL